MFILQEQLSSPPVFKGVRVGPFLIFSVVFCRSLFDLFLMVISFYVFLLFTASDYPFVIFFHWFTIAMYLEKYIAKKESSFSLKTSIDISEYEIYLSFSGLSKLFILRDNCFNPMECLSSMSYAQPTNKPEVNTDTRKCRAILSSNDYS